MIYVRLYGGIGNQLFQYAFSRKLQEQFQQDVCFEYAEGTTISNQSGDTTGSLGLRELPLAQKGIIWITSKKEFAKRAGWKMWIADVLCYLPRGVRRFTGSETAFEYLTEKIQQQFNKHGYYTSYDHYTTPQFNKEITDIYVNGLFSCRKYFDDIYKSLCNELLDTTILDEKNMEFMNRIRESNSICLHVRKGSSYVNNKSLDVCDAKYFENALQCITNEISNPRFFLFTNDIEWCRQNIPMKQYDCVWVDANSSAEVAKELQLMSACKHFILSNSTLSWWACYLNSNSNKMVVSPQAWSKGKKELLKDVMEDDWIRV